MKFVKDIYYKSKIICLNHHNPFANDSIVVFHHIPKCSGTSVRFVLGKWYIIVPQYNHPKVNLTNLMNYNCLAGHMKLSERYPELLNDSRYKVISFLRDPLEAKVSMYYYSIKKGWITGEEELTTFLSRTNNWLASMLECTAENYQEVIDKYFFIGLAEYHQKSLNILSEKLGKRHEDKVHLYQTKRDRRINKITTEFKNKFYKENDLDYSIYRYVEKKYFL